MSRIRIKIVFRFFEFVFAECFGILMRKSLLNIMSVLTMNEKLMCCASIYFQIEVKVVVEVRGVLEVV